MENKQYQNFNIIKFRGDPETVTLINGTVIKNNHEDFIWVPEFSGFVRKAPYGNHFVFEVPKELRGSPSHMCSCGSPAIFIGSKDYAHLGSAEGMMLVCMFHTNDNRHADGSA